MVPMQKEMGDGSIFVWPDVKNEVKEKNEMYQSL